MTFNFFFTDFFWTDLFFSHTFCKLFNKQNNLWSRNCICVARSGTVNTKQYMKLKFYKFKIKIIKLINLKKLTLQEADKECIWCHLWKRSWSSDFKLVQSAGGKEKIWQRTSTNAYSHSCFVTISPSSGHSLPEQLIFFYYFFIYTNVNINVLPSSRQSKWRHCRYSLSLMKPLSGVAQPSANTCTHCMSTCRSQSDTGQCTCR